MYPCTSCSAGRGRIVFQYIIVLGMTHLKTRGYVVTNNKLLVLPFSGILCLNLFLFFISSISKNKMAKVRFTLLTDSFSVLEIFSSW